MARDFALEFTICLKIDAEATRACRTGEITEIEAGFCFETCLVVDSKNKRRNLHNRSLSLDDQSFSTFEDNRATTMTCVQLVVDSLVMVEFQFLRQLF